jgi:hypothetical protein
MILKSVDGSEFEVQISDYEFPQIENDEWDSNWLKVNLRAKTLTSEWSISTPCLDTYEAAELCDWLRMLADGHQVKMSLSFLEPEFAFQIMETSEAFIVLQVKSRDWQKMPNRISFAYKVERKQLHQVAEMWCSEIQQFPTRVERNRKKP